MTAEQQITKSIDLWTSAIKSKSTQGRGSSKKRELYGIKKLRELILELAVRGKLVPQDPNDEPASVLLERIAAERAQWVKENKIKKPKKLPEISDNEKPFKLPNGWSWARFGEVFDMAYGDNLPEAKRSNTGEYPVYGSNGVVGSHEKCLINQPCIVIGRKGSAGALNLCLNDGCWVTDVAYSLVPPSGLDLNFIFKLLHTLGLDDLGKGIKPGLSRNEANILLFCVPPIEEQHRIVAKVDELMALCDQLEQKTEASLDAHQLLVDTLLESLIIAKDAGELGEAWTRLSAHFDTLITTDYAVEQFKQTILELAVMGKLVRQKQTDEPASELLKRIAAEKEQLIKNKKIKKQPPLPKITDKDKPFELPEGWEWCNLSDVQALVTDGDHQAPPKASSGIPFLVIGNLNAGTVNFDGCNYVPKEYYLGLDWGRKPSAGDMLYTVTGSYGIPVKIDSDDQFCVQRHVAILKATKSTPSAYLQYALKSKLAFGYAEKIATGIAQKTVPLTGLRKMPIPLPPLNEQQHIVAKVEQLIALCDKLKSRLSETQTTQLHLADAVVYELTGEPVKNIEDAGVDAKAMKITTILLLNHEEFGGGAVIAPIIRELGGSADAKDVWSKTKMSLPAFYAQLKIEIDAKYIIKPASADFEEV